MLQVYQTLALSSLGKICRSTWADSAAASGLQHFLVIQLPGCALGLKFALFNCGPKCSKARPKDCTVQRPQSGLVFLALLFAQPCWAVHIYRSPLSQFSSGDASVPDLEKTRKELTVRSWYQVRWSPDSEPGSSLQGWVRSSTVLTSLDVCVQAKIKTPSAPVHASLNFQHSPRQTISQGTDVRLLERDENYFHVLFGRNKSGWVEANLIEPDSRDLGAVFSKEHASLHVKPSGSSRSFFQLPQGEKFPILQRHGPWVQIAFKSKKGWVHLNQMISKLDFARSLTLKNHESIIATAFTGSWVETAQGVFKSLDDVETFNLNPNLLIVGLSRINAHEFPNFTKGRLLPTLGFGHKLEMIHAENIQWARSNLKGEEIWWLPSEAQRALEEIKQTSADKSSAFTTAQVFARKVFDIATSPRISKLTFMSANGVFRTLDGENWDQLKIFGEENYPIAVTSRGTVVVGPYVSFDHGLNFKPYLRWDKVISTLVKGGGGSGLEVESIKMTKIEEITASGTGNSEALRLTFQTDSGRSFQAITTGFGRTWKRLGHPEMP